ncbi:GNAT family N-acetyltransferase [Kitasatospora sp. NPDC008115]|uniref:GNAT family N-acetyltransferase n=1 Tax=Kitasatospora sp. NPDC008115 TaxID=3364022 RepID=UPI0036E48B8F
MIEDGGTTDTDFDDEETRVVSWRNASVGLAVLDVEDAELLQGWRSDPVAAHEIGFWPRSLSELRERVERDRDNNDRDDFLVLLPSGVPIGHIALTDQDLVNGTAHVELVLDPGHRGRGYGTAALDALVDLAFGELPLHRLAVETHTDNGAALAALARSGFVPEGVSRSACFHRGRRYDLAVLSLLRTDWEALDRPRAWDV